jgi:3-mercaptopyruvate sulfurtransferase SseA
MAGDLKRSPPALPENGLTPLQTRDRFALPGGRSQWTEAGQSLEPRSPEKPNENIDFPSNLPCIATPLQGGEHRKERDVP